MVIEQSKQSRFQKWFNRFFGIGEKEKTPLVIKRRLRPWQQGGGYGFGKPAWMRSERVMADWNKPKAGKVERQLRREVA